MSAGSTVARPLSSPAPRSRLTPCACSASSRSCRRSLALGLGHRVGGRAVRFGSGGLALRSGLARGDLAPPALTTVRVIAALTSSRYSERSTISGAAVLELDRHAGGARLVDLARQRTAPSARRRRSGQAACAARRPRSYSRLGLLAELAARRSRSRRPTSRCAANTLRGALAQRASPAPSRARGPAARRPTRCRRPGSRSALRAAAGETWPIARS